MKRSIVLFVSLLFFVGCNTENLDLQTWDKLGIKFSYPKNLVAAENEVSETGDIHVKKQSADELIGCADAWFEDLAAITADSDTNYYQLLLDRRDENEKALMALKKEGLNDETSETIMQIESMTCGFAGGNMNMTPIVISGLNGVVTTKRYGQDCCNINSWKTEVMVVDSYNDVYTIIFDYDFGNLAQFSTEDYSGTYSFSPDSDEAIQIDAFFEKEDPIKIEWLKAFEDNKNIIVEIIKTIEITN